MNALIDLFLIFSPFILLGCARLIWSKGYRLHGRWSSEHVCMLPGFDGEALMRPNESTWRCYSCGSTWTLHNSATRFWWESPEERLERMEKELLE